MVSPLRRQIACASPTRSPSGPVHATAPAVPHRLGCLFFTERKRGEGPGKLPRTAFNSPLPAPCNSRWFAPWCQAGGRCSASVMLSLLRARSTTPAVRSGPRAAAARGRAPCARKSKNGANPAIREIARRAVTSVPLAAMEHALAVRLEEGKGFGPFGAASAALRVSASFDEEVLSTVRALACCALHPGLSAELCTRASFPCSPLQSPARRPSGGRRWPGRCPRSVCVASPPRALAS